MANIRRANVMVCRSTGCDATNSLAVIEAMKEEINHRGLEDEIEVVQTGCRGFCAMGPVMDIYPGGIFYCRVQPADVPEIVEETLIKGRVVERLSYKDPVTGEVIPIYEDIPFYSKQS